jgi:hypothetical protein
VNIFHPGGVDAVDGLRKQADVLRVRGGGQVLGHGALERAGGRKVQLVVHAQRIQVRRQRRQLPQVAVAQAAVRVQAHLDDARVQPQVQKVRQPHQHAGQHAPVDARRGQRWSRQR